MHICVSLGFADCVSENTRIKEKYPVLERPVGKINMTNYPVGDFLIKIKNAAMSRRKDVEVDYSNLTYAVSEVLKKEMYLSDIKRKDDRLMVKLAYFKKEPVLVGLKLVSKPGRRVYKKVDEISKHKGLSFFLLSTPIGIISSREAIKKNIGGEVIAEIH